MSASRPTLPPVYVLTCTAALSDGASEGLFDDLDCGDVLHWERAEALVAMREGRCSCGGAGRHRVVRYEVVTRRARRTP